MNHGVRQSNAHSVFDKSISSTAGEFRNLTSLALLSALKQAGTTVYEPNDRFHLEIPADTLGSVLTTLSFCGICRQKREPTSGLTLLSCSLRVSLFPTLNLLKMAVLQPFMTLLCPSSIRPYR